MATITARTPSAFASSSFTRFYAGQTLSYLGDGLRTLAIPLLVFRLTGSAVAVGTTWGIELLPYAVVSLVGGSLADRVDRRLLMIVCDALRFVIMALFSLLFFTGHLTMIMIYGGVFALAICGSVFLGAQSASVPFLLGKDGAKGGVAALQATEQTVNLIGPPIGGALMGLVGPLPALLLNALTYLCSQVAIATVPTFGPERPGKLPTLRELRSDIADGWRFLNRDRAMRTLSLLSCAFNFVGTIGFVALVPYFKHAFYASDAVIGLAFGCFAGGAAVGSILAGRTHWPLGRSLIAIYVLDGIGWLPLPFTHSLALAVAGVTASSVCSGFLVTSIVSWRMRVIPEDLIGRVFGAVRFVVLCGILPGSLLGGWLADHEGVRATMAVSALGYLAFTLVLACSKTVRRERR